MIRALDYISTILNSIQEAEDILKENKDMIYEREQESTDLSHEIELINFNAYNGYRLAKELQTVLQERRKAKEENETLEILVEFINKNPQFKNGLVQCEQKINQMINRINQRKYTPRVRKELDIAKHKGA